MSRPLRIACEEAWYHVLSRGNERRPVFRDGRDYGRFVDLLGAMSERFGMEVWSYALMGNHYHLVLRPREANLSQAMQWLGVAYSVWHNRRHRRSGHLFQGRFKSVLVTEDEYLARLICYVHRNPVRARLVERLAEYPWSSYRALAYGKGCPGWLSRKGVLRLYGGGAEGFRRAVQEYSEEKRRLWEELRLGVYLGSEEGLARLWRRARPEAHREKPASRQLMGRESVGEAVERWRRALGVSPEELALLRRPIRGRERPERDVLIHAVWNAGGRALGEIGEYFGVGYTSVVNARGRAAVRLRRDRALRKRLEATALK